MRYLTFLIAVLVLIACNSNANEPSASGAPDGPAESPRINVKVEGLQGGTAYLIGVFADQNYRLDSAAVDASGAMLFQREEPYPSGFVYVFLPDRNFIQMLVDKDQTFSLTTRSGDLVNAMQVEGSLDNELLYRNLKFQNEQTPLFDEVNRQIQGLTETSPGYAELKARQEQLIADRKNHLEEIFTTYPDAFFTKFKKAGQNPDVQDVRNPDGTVNQPLQVYLYRRDFWNDVDFNDERLLRTPVIANKLTRYITELTAQNPDSIIASADFLIEQLPPQSEYYKFIVNWIVLKYEPTKTTLMDAEAVFVHMMQNYFTQERAFWTDSAEVYAIQLRAHEMAASLMGQKGPDVQAKDPGGQLRSIYEIKAPYIIVYMYNPTCEHCMEETPKLVNFYRQWKSKGVEVFAIAVDTDDAEWKAYIAKNGMNWINVFDPTNKAIYAKYFVDNTPEIYVLNPDRTIIAKNLKVSQIEEMIRRDQEKRGGGQR